MIYIIALFVLIKSSLSQRNNKLIFRRELYRIRNREVKKNNYLG